ncbi:hypothetical protein GCM10023144_00550 [Pigmentiphaga soli]|uniref:DUF4089 domain-containing protein n=1 Tax=Pigmentiphaga soli TaxID=1007095 RepID=A0ABP8GCI6_9BURK
MNPDTRLVDILAGQLAGYPVAPARAAELLEELRQLHEAVAGAAAMLAFDDAPADFARVLEAGAP